MSSYLYPNLASKKAYREAIAAGKEITAEENTPFGSRPIVDGSVAFEGPHFPKPHRFYGIARVVSGKVVSVK